MSTQKAKGLWTIGISEAELSALSDCYAGDVLAQGGSREIENAWKDRDGRLWVSTIVLEDAQGCIHEAVGEELVAPTPLTAPESLVRYRGEFRALGEAVRYVVAGSKGAEENEDSAAASEHEHLAAIREKALAVARLQQAHADRKEETKLAKEALDAAYGELLTLTLRRESEMPLFPDRSAEPGGPETPAAEDKKTTPAVAPETENRAAVKAEEGHAVPPAEDADLYARAVAVVRKEGRGSPALLRRRLGITLPHADVLLRSMESEGLVGAEGPGGNRPVLAEA